MADKQHDNLAALDRALALEQAKRYLSPEEFNAWRRCRYTFRTFVHYNKIFVLWEMDDEVPKILGSVTALEPSICRREGIGIQVLVKTNQEYEVLVPHCPTPIFEDRVFCHVPFNATTLYTPSGMHKGLQIPLVIKTEAKPWDILNGGARLTQLSEFRSTYPKFKDLIL